MKIANDTMPPAGSYLDADTSVLDGLSESLEGMDLEHIESAKGRHYGQSSNIMMFKAVMDIRNDYIGENGYYHESNFKKRPEFWAIHPWQLKPEEVPVPFKFPDENLIQDLVKLFLDRINYLIPFVHGPSFLKNIEKGLHFNDRQFGALVLAVCAVGARFSKDPRIFEDGSTSEQSVGWRWIRQVDPIKKSFTSPSSVYELQLYGVYIMFMQCTTTPEYCWVLIKVGLSMALDVGAHRKRPPNTKPTLENELWKRAFWVLYILDIFASSFLGRPRSITTEDFDVDLPVDCDDEYWQGPNSEIAFKPPARPSSASYIKCLIKLLDILAHAIGTIYAVRREDIWTAMGLSELEWNQKIVAELDSLLNNWVDDLPGHLKWDPNRQDFEHFRCSANLYVTYCKHWIQILVHRRFIPKPGQMPVLSFPSLAIIANAARSCLLVVEISERRNACLVGMPNVVMALFNASIVLLVNVWQGRRLKPSDSLDLPKELEDVARAVQTLHQYERSWESAGRYSDILTEIISISCLHHEKTTSTLKRRREGEEGNALNDIRSKPYRMTRIEPRPIAGSNRVSEPFEATSELHQPLGGFSLPIHTNELGSLPIFDSFTWPQTAPWAFTFDSQPSNAPAQTQCRPLSTDFSESLTDSLMAPYSYKSMLERPSSEGIYNSTAFSNQTSSVTNEWDHEWNSYMANIEEVLHSINPSI
ncbi:fungal-specific transcription factor domain-containing protein [Rhodocollybia butyracea]|uniref:Fungal-specific transcription factor domain-containing protein n=1 Tax=Rhodocollybia butyracea TaxID=206335 RepID=A0A9P5UFW5_9AGAR|nr:fungal-specific transcription factor domain-containing protein [Rhodocollybia butyracea]